MLQICGLNKSFGSVDVINNFSKNFDSGYIYLLTGPNGSGKTTLLKIIKGIIVPDSGHITFNKAEYFNHKCCYVDSNTRSFFHRLTVKENLLYFMSLNNMSRDEKKIFSLANIFNADKFIDTIFGDLSLGQMQLISLIRGLLQDPSILMLDEACTNLDKATVEIFSGYIEDFVENDQEKMVIICSHVNNFSLDFRERFSLR